MPYLLLTSIALRCGRWIMNLRPLMRSISARSLPTQLIHDWCAGRDPLCQIHGTKYRSWLATLLARRPTKVAAIALANQIARMAWAMMTEGERYGEPIALAA